MMPMSYMLAAYLLVVVLSIGAAVGALAGIAAASALKYGSWRVGSDAILGAVGLVGTLAFFVVMPWPRNTIVEIHNGSAVQSTMNRYQHPWRVALPAAVVVPLVHEIYRRVRHRSSLP